MEANDMNDADIFDDEDDSWMEEAVNDVETSDVSTSSNLTSPTPQHLQILEKWFGHKQFKPLQWEIIRSILDEKQDQCIVMATGYGKSLCYQYPAVFEKKVSLVVSPLIALMEDQVLSLKVNNIPACYLGSAQTEKQETYNDIASGSMRVVYVTPEFVDSSLDLLRTILPSERLSLIAVDEAHCVSQWGHDFRASYRQLHKLKLSYQSVPFISLTATATDTVTKDICEALKLKNPKISKTSFDRPNLFIEVGHKTTIMRDLSGLMKNSDDPNSLKKRFSGPTIIYCPTRKEVEKVSNELNSHGLKALPYHAGLGNKERSCNQKEFVHDRCDVIVCTVAFGMGIDKPDVRNVIHYGAPKDMESYYQEIGRAGRDGARSMVKVFYSAGDFQTHRYLLGDLGNESWKKHKTTLLHQMEVYLALKKKCRRKEILNHFNESFTDERRENCCDNCSGALLFSKCGSTEPDSDEKVEFTEDSKLLLEAVKVCKGYYGLGMPVAVLKGAKDKKMKEYLTQYPIFGQGKHKSKEFWMALGRALVAEGYIDQTQVAGAGGQSFRRMSFTTVKISEKGRKFLNDLDGKVVLIPTKNMKTVKKSPVTLNSVSRVSNLLDFEAEKSQPNPEKDKLFVELLELRNKLAMKLSLAPYMIFSEEILLQLAEIRPSTVSSLTKMGLTEAKIQKFGQEVLDFILSWNQDKNLDLDNFPPELAFQAEETLHQLSETQRTSYLLFKDMNDLDKVAASRALKPSTIITHLCEAIKLGLPVNLSLSESTRTRIENAIASPTIDSNVLRLAPIKEECDKNVHDKEVSWDDIKVVVAILTAKHGVKDNRLLWNPGEIQSQSITKEIDETNSSPRSARSESSMPGSSLQVIRRDVPAWMSNSDTRSEVMAKRKKKSSIFNF